MIFAPLIATVVLGTPMIVETKLRWHELDPNESLVSSMPRNVFFLEPEGRTKKGYTAPKGLYKPRFFAWSYGPEQLYIGVVGSSTEHGEIDRLWVDWNEDKKFENSEQASIASGVPKNATIFRYKNPPKAKYGAVHPQLQIIAKNYISLSPAGYMEGQINLQGKKIKVGVIDSNYDGRPGGDTGKGQVDYYLIDRNGNGKFEPTLSGPNAGPSEIIALSGLIELTEGKFWHPVNVLDGSKFRLVESDLPTGQLDFGKAQIQSITIKSAQGWITTQPKGSHVNVPAGSCEIGTANLTIVSEPGEKWTYVIGGVPMKKVDIKAGEVTPIQVGAPLSFDINVTNTGPSCYFSLSLKDASGLNVTGLYDAKYKQVKEPSLVISDSNGKVVKTLPFAYG